MENTKYIINYPSETTLEDTIVMHLSESPLYNVRTSAQFDIKRLCDPEMLQQFIQLGQPDKWIALQKRFGSEAMEQVVREYNRQVDNHGMLKVLRDGFTLQGIKIKLLQFKPDQSLNVPFVALYGKNIFSVVRQMRYSTAMADRLNELDFVILINGIPFITCELKAESKGQNIINGMDQYCNNRDAANRMLSSCLVHFVIDENRVMMTTSLRGKQTKFLPFNRGTENPIIEGTYATAYMWHEVLQADSLLNILQNFIKQYVPTGSKSKQRVTIFPRYHQLGCVRRLLDRVREDGAGESYLVQHSAGSGKSKSIAWLAHQLSDLHDSDNNPIYDSIIVVTDRIVLDSAISDEIKDFETVAGVVYSVKKGSSKLAEALEKGKRIIITTVQKFANARKHLSELKGAHFAVIIDEAHSSQNGESAKDVKITLTDSEVLKNIIEESGVEIENDTDKLLSEIQVARGQIKHISYFAFTATPKEQTLAIFGDKSTGEPHEVYTMRQAIEEGFILDVLKSYTTFQSMFELVGDKSLDEELEEKEYDKKKALGLMMKYVCDNPYTISYKADMMLAHFMSKTISKINGSAKAMVVTNSRASAVAYKLYIDKKIKESYGDKISALVAFSGTVEINEHTYTEESMNGFGVKDAAIRDEFKRDNVKILIVANKFQTGFDQPLLHTMYVDKQLGGVQAIQTLSRLNRACEYKEDTMVIDFVNKHEDIQTAFQHYYQTTMLDGTVDTQKLYDFKSQIDSYKLFSEAQINDAIEILVDSSKNAESLSPMYREIVEESVSPLEKDEQTKLRKLVDRYVRQYTYLAQLMTFIDPELEKYYLFCKMLYKFLPYTSDTLPLDILNRIDLDKFKVAESGNGSILLENEDGKLKQAGDGRVSTPKPGELTTLLGLLKEINEPYAGFLAENDKLIHTLLFDVYQDAEVQSAFSAPNTVDVLIELVKEKFNEKCYFRMNEHLNLITVMQENQSFTESFFRKAFEFIAAATSGANQLEYDEDALKLKLYEAMVYDFKNLKGIDYGDMKDVIDVLFNIFSATSVDSLDGLNTLLKETMNRIYRGENRDVDLQLYFQTLVSKYEAFLRKIHFLLQGVELSEESKPSGLVSVVQQFPAIQKLYSTKEITYSKMKDYYHKLYNWRNNHTHQAPTLDKAELAPSIQVIVAMYVYAAMVSATQLGEKES
ncbi:MAG: DEAD/DEAH box helicase family protein [Rikenellaceae bacterium]